MDRIVYTATMAKYASNAADFITGESWLTSRRVDFRYVLGHIMPPRSIDPFVKVFFNWHRKFVDSANAPAVKTISTAILNEPPLMVAGQLNEFSRAVRLIVDTAITLSDAANIVRQYGHCKNGSGNYTKGFCIAGAIDLAIQSKLSSRKNGRVHAELVWTSALNVLTDYLHTVLITEWNDAPSTTVSDVVNVLEWAASDIVTVRF